MCIRDSLINRRYDGVLPDAASYRQIFGWADDSQRHIKSAATGGIVFHDAILYEVPQEVKQVFTLDVMTPHFTEYYRSDGKKAPHDGDSPNPVTFLTVNAGLTFAFAVSARKGISDDVRKQARSWLRKGLIEMGIGSKTAAGYGIFEPMPKQ
jgi:CRISPR-associated protein Cmr6